jgi:PT repeat-containing protein
VSLRTRWTLALAVGSAALLLAAGCGSDGGSGDSGEGPVGASAYLDCLRDQGIDVPDTMPSGRPSGFPSGRPTAFPSGRPTAFPSDRPSGAPGGGRMGGFRPEGVDDATWQKAQEACAASRPTGGPNGDGPGGGNREAGAAYRNCLADRGVDLGANPSTTDPKVAEAIEACAVLRPSASATP